MKPSTPKTELPPLTQLRNAVFGDLLKNIGLGEVMRKFPHRQPFALVVAAAVALLFGSLTANATTFYSTYGQNRTETVTLTASGTHTFEVDRIASSKKTEWYVNTGAGYVYKETDNSGLLAIDPDYSWTFSSGTTAIKAIVYNSDWSVKETHIWNVSVRTIISAYWLTPVYVTEGAVVTMRAQVTGFNVGDQFAFEIREDDYPLGSDYVTTRYGNVYSSGGNLYVDATWTSVWQSDQSGDPEFYLVASRGSVSKESSRSDAYEMHVTQAESVSQPNTPSGPSSGSTGQSLSFSTGGAANNKGHSLQYRFDWGDGSFSTWSSSTSVSNSWPSSGTYNVKTQARCATHTSVVSIWSSAKTVTITCPSPGTPSTPNPANGATVSSQPTILDWADTSGAASYDVYLDGTFRANVPVSQWTLNQTLSFTAHNWYVVAKNGCGSTQGSTWSFTINPPPQTIMSAYWLTPNYVTEGAVGTMRALVSGYNVGDQFAFEIREDDGILGSDHVTTRYGNVYSSGGNYYVDATWPTVWQSDQSGDPEYYFVVSRGGSSLASSTVDANEMHVTQALDPYGVGALEPSGIGLFSTIPVANRNNLTDLADLKNNGLYYGSRLVNSTDRKLIIVFHGWNPDRNPDQRLTSITDAIESANIGADWRAIAYDWSRDASTGLIIPASPHMDLKSGEMTATNDVTGGVETKLIVEENATKAAERAYQHGLLLGAKILQQVGTDNLQAVHLVGHSAGSWAAYGALRYLNANASSTTLFQATYLDPYVPADVPFNVNPHFTRAQQESSPNYCRITGQLTARTEQYWADDIKTVGTDTPYSFTSQPSVVFRTVGFPYGDTNWDGHSGPIVFYLDTIIKPDHPQASGHGWKHSLAHNEDMTSPTVTISGPNGGQTFTSSPITVSGSASDPGSPSSGVALVEVRVNSGAWQTANGTTSWNRSVSLASGSNLIEVRGRDNAGNYSTIPSVSVTHNPPDVSPPTVAISSPTTRQTFTSSPIAISGSASDPGSPSSGLALVEVRVNSGVWQTASGTTSWNRSVSLASGSNLIEARSRDNAGNYSTIPSVSVTYSFGTNSPPQLTGMALSSGVLRFNLNGPVGSTVVIEASSDMMNWLPIITNTVPVSGSLLVTDPGIAIQPRRFYRAMLQY